MRACLYCGGSGVHKEYENNAGDYHFEHCAMCDGVGKEIPERIEALRQARLARIEDYERKKAAAPWWYRWML